MLDKYWKECNWGKRRIPDRQCNCAIVLQGKSVLILGLFCGMKDKRRRPCLSVMEVTASLQYGLPADHVNAIVKYLKPQVPSVEATNTSYYLTISVMIFYFIKIRSFTKDTRAQNILLHKSKANTSFKLLLLLFPAVTSNHEGTWVPTSFSCF